MNAPGQFKPMVIPFVREQVYLDLSRGRRQRQMRADARKAYLDLLPDVTSEHSTPLAAETQASKPMIRPISYTLNLNFTTC